MSKSRGNVVNPDEVVRAYGADSLRLYEMFMGPLEQVKPWSMKGVEGVHRFLRRVWRLVLNEETGALNADVVEAAPERDQLRALHTAIRDVTEHLDQMRFNTGIAAMMIFLNEAVKWERKPRAALRTFVLLLSPFAPHLAEELWEQLGGRTTLAYEPWPAYDPALLAQDTIEIAVQVNGRLRGRIVIPVNAAADAALAAAKAEPGVAIHLAGKPLRKEIYVPGKIVNLVVG